jgi:predicted lipid-binding transport protein (Tim44 family)
MVGFSETSIVEANMDGARALITVKFVSDQIKVTRDSKNEVVDGEPGKVVPVTDIWTFARDTRARNPNWTLVATEAAN